MKISNKAIRELRGKIPSGSIRKIKQRLANKSINFSEQYIYRCLDPNKDDYNEIIIKEAILVCEEAAARKAAMERRITDLTLSIICGPLVPCLYLISDSLFMPISDLVFLT